MTDMKIRALAPWFGGKRTLAESIVTELGKHTQYFEPFCGSMAVLLGKPPSQKETVNDLHGDITCLGRVVSVLDPAAALYDRLQRVLMSDSLLLDAQAVLEDEEDLRTVQEEMREYPGAVTSLMAERAYWFFIASWMGRNGTAGTDRPDYQLAVRWTVSGGSPTVRFRSAVESIPAWHERLRNVVILNRDGFEVINRYEDRPGTAIYADPPYAAETRSNAPAVAGGGGGGGGGRYKHEFKHDSSALFGGPADDHQRLADELRKYKHARVVVSAYDCPRYRELYEGWTFVEHTMLKLLHQQNGRGTRSKEAPEVLIVNGPSFAKEGA